jgi:hypothetical protein
MLIQVPIEFEFRKTKVMWSETHVRVTGWWKRSDGSVDGENLIAEIIGGKRTVKFPLERLPQKYWEQCVAKQSPDGNIERIPDAGVAETCSEFEPQLLIRSDKTYDLPYLQPMKPSQSADAWQMRKEFLLIKPDCKNALAFLNKWGSWDFGEYTLLTDIIHLQQIVREGLTHSKGCRRRQHRRVRR